MDEVNTAPASDGRATCGASSPPSTPIIDDFESYTNDSPNRVFQAWIDGWGFSKDEFFPKGDPGNGSGSMVGYDPAVGNIMETSITHGGTQAMPVEYNNVNTSVLLRGRSDLVDASELDDQRRHRSEPVVPGQSGGLRGNRFGRHPQRRGRGHLHGH